MKKRVIGIVSIALAVILSFISSYLLFFVVGIRKQQKKLQHDFAESLSPEDPNLKSEQITQEGFCLIPNPGRVFEAYGDVTAESVNGILSGYTVGDYTFRFESTLDSSAITDTVYCNQQDIYYKFYQAGDMYPDLMAFGNNLVTVLYDEEAHANGLIVNDGSLETIYDEDGNLSQSQMSNTTEHLYEYDEHGRLTREVGITGKEKLYHYAGDVLVGDDINCRLDTRGDSILYTQGDVTFEYVFGHTYENQKLVTEIKKNGNDFVHYAYLNNRITRAEYADGSYVTYILDAELNYLGMIFENRYYYFVYDLAGNVFSILRDDGEVIAFYDRSAYDLPACNSYVARVNSIVNPDVIMDHESMVLITDSTVLVPESGVKVCLGSTRSNIKVSDTLYDCEIGIYDKREGIPLAMAIRGKVLEEASAYLETEGYECAINLRVLDADGHYADQADLYILNTDCAQTSVKNVFKGDRIYKVLEYNTVDTERYEALQRQIGIYADPENGYRVECTGLYAPMVGDIIFEGQFVYCDYLVTYTADENGIITYRTTKNSSVGYKNFNNIYNIDGGQYALYQTNTFSLEDWDYTAIIPGLNREQYEVIESYIQEAMLINTQTTFDNVEYFDESYYDSYLASCRGDTLDLFEGLDDRSMVVLSSDGNLTISAIPFDENTKLKRQMFWTVANSILAVVVAGVVAVVVPGTGAMVVYTIVKSAVVTGLVNMATSLVISSVVDVASEYIFGKEMTASVDERLYHYWDSAMDRYRTGLVMGTVAGIFQSASIVKGIKGDTIIKQNSVSKKTMRELKSYDELGSLIYDDASVYHAREMLLLSIESGTSSGGTLVSEVALFAKKNAKLIGLIFKSGAYAFKEWKWLTEDSNDKSI